MFITAVFGIACLGSVIDKVVCNMLIRRRIGSEIEKLREVLKKWKKKHGSQRLESRNAFLTKNILTRMDLKKRDDVIYHKISDSFSFEFMKTGDFKTDQHYNYLHGTQRVYEAFVAEFKNCILLGEFAIPITSSGKIVLEPFGTVDVLRGRIERTYRIAAFLRLRFLLLRVKFFGVRARLTHDRVFHMVARTGQDNDSPSYGHWILENLPQLRLYECLSQRPKILIRKGASDFVYDSLSLLGVRPANLTSSADKVISVTSLFVPRLAAACMHGAELDPEGLQWVSKKLKNAASLVDFSSKGGGYPKIYVPRLKMRRTAVNQKRESSTVEEYGFTEIQPEEFSFKEEIRSFSDCEIFFASPAGSVLANMLFMHERGIVIAVENTDIKFDNWRIVAEQLGLAYFHIPGYPVGESTKPRDKKLEVDISQLKGILARVTGGQGRLPRGFFVEKSSM